MSKENVALFVRMIAEKRDLNKKATAEKNTRRWVELGKEAGLDYNEKDVVEFVTEMIKKKVTADNAILEFLTAMSSDEMSDDQLDKVSGGTSRSSGQTTQFSSNLSRTLISNGYTPPGGLGAQYVEFPPDPAMPSSNPQGQR